MVLAARNQVFSDFPSRGSQLDSRPDFESDGGIEACTTAYGDYAVSTGRGTHRVADVSDRGLVLVEALATLDARLRSLHRRITAAVVRGEPMPAACETLPEMDHLVARIKAEWNETMRDGSRRDPDPEQWSRCLLAATDACFTAWCFDCLCELSGGGLVRIDTGDSSEAWVAEEPVLLAEDLATALDGDRIDLVADPLRRPEGRILGGSCVLQTS